MELRHLRYFIAVAEERHFSRAAERLHIAQPPLSQQIHSLEQELGVTLLLRTKRSVTVTEAGQAFLEEAKRALAQVERAIEVTQQVHRGERGRLEIGFVGSAMVEALPVALRTFRQRFPLVTLGLHQLTTSQQIDALHDGCIQLGFLRPPLADSSLAVEIIRREPLLVALSEQHPLAAQECISLSSLRDEVFVLYPRQLGPGTYDQLITLCDRAGFTIQVVQEAVEMQTITGLVAAGLGISLVPASTQHLRKAQVVYRPLQEQAATVDLALAWVPEGISATRDEFLHVVRETSATGYGQE